MSTFSFSTSYRKLSTNLLTRGRTLKEDLGQISKGSNERASKANSTSDQPLLMPCKKRWCFLEPCHNAVLEFQDIGRELSFMSGTWTSLHLFRWNLQVLNMGCPTESTGLYMLLNFRDSAYTSLDVLHGRSLPRDMWSKHSGKNPNSNLAWELSRCGLFVSQCHGS